jgi:hypothetical protein
VSEFNAWLDTESLQADVDAMFERLDQAYHDLMNTVLDSTVETA